MDSSSSKQSVKARMAEKMKKLKELHMKRNEARQLNHKEVVEEDKRQKLPANWEARRKKAEWILNEEQQKQEAASRGEDYERIKRLNVTATEAEQAEWRKKRKTNKDTGFSDFEQATVRQYNRLVKGMKPNMELYMRERERLGDAFYGGPNTILHGLHKDKKEDIDRMVDDLEKQITKREKYSRRRTHNDEADIDYINDRNMKFNKKLERFYGEYTTEIKQNLERGTAV